MPSILRIEIGCLITFPPKKKNYCFQMCNDYFDENIQKKKKKKRKLTRWVEEIKGAQSDFFKVMAILVWQKKVHIFLIIHGKFHS